MSLIANDTSNPIFVPPVDNSYTDWAPVPFKRPSYSPSTNLDNLFEKPYEHEKKFMPKYLAPPQVNLHHLEQIHRAQKDALSLLKEVQAFNGTKKDKHFLFLNDMFVNIQIKYLDSIKTEDKEEERDIKNARKQMTWCLQKCADLLEEKADCNTVNEPPPEEMQVEETVPDNQSDGDFEMVENPDQKPHSMPDVLASTDQTKDVEQHDVDDKKEGLHYNKNQRDYDHCFEQCNSKPKNYVNDQHRTDDPRSKVDDNSKHSCYDYNSPESNIGKYDYYKLNNPEHKTDSYSHTKLDNPEAKTDNYSCNNLGNPEPKTDNYSRNNLGNPEPKTDNYSHARSDNPETKTRRDQSRDRPDSKQYRVDHGNFY